MTSFHRLPASILACVLWTQAALCADFNGPQDAKPHVRAIHIDRPLQISGRLDDTLWRSAQSVSLPYETDPGENTPAPQQTFASFLYTRDYLYVGFRCHDSRPNEIRANMTDRDRIYKDDFVMAVLDTYADNQRGYEFAVNPYGVQADLMRTLNGEDDTFDLVWQSAAARNDSGWTAEMAIPFKSLRFSGREEQTWSLLLYRV